MRFTINREEFLKGLLIASRAVGAKSANAILNNFKITLNEKGLFILGSNGQLSIQTMVPYAQGEKEIIRNYKEGEILLNAKLITDIARSVESPEITVDAIDSGIALVSDNHSSEFKLNCLRPEDFLDLDLEPSGTSFKISTKDFSLIVNQTAFAASQKEQRPVLTAVNLKAENSVLVATATDSARLARKELTVTEGIEFNANISAKMLVEVSHLAEGSEDIEIAISDQKALFAFGFTIVTARLTEGDYPKTDNIIPKILNYSLEVNAGDIVKAIERASLLSIERENVVSLHMSSDSVEISSKSSQIGSASEKIEVFKYEGEELEVSFNSEFVLSAIRVLGSTDVTLSFVGEMKPFVIKNSKDDSVIQLVTPMRTF